MTMVVSFRMLHSCQDSQSFMDLLNPYAVAAMVRAVSARASFRSYHLFKYRLGCMCMLKEPWHEEVALKASPSSLSSIGSRIMFPSISYSLRSSSSGYSAGSCVTGQSDLAQVSGPPDHEVTYAKFGEHVFIKVPLAQCRDEPVEQTLDDVRLLGVPWYDLRYPCTRTHW